jgi:hypothetical protein
MCLCFETILPYQHAALATKDLPSEQKYHLFVLTLTSSLGLFLSLYRGLLVVLSFAYFLDNAVTRSLTLETSESAVKRFILFYFYLTHCIFPPSAIAWVNFFLTL